MRKFGFISCGAGGGTRTRTLVATEPKSVESANSTTPAYKNILAQVREDVNKTGSSPFVIFPKAQGGRNKPREHKCRKTWKSRGGTPENRNFGNVSYLLGDIVILYKNRKRFLLQTQKFKIRSFYGCFRKTVGV